MAIASVVEEVVSIEVDSEQVSPGRGSPPVSRADSPAEPGEPSCVELTFVSWFTSIPLVADAEGAYRLKGGLYY